MNFLNNRDLLDRNVWAVAQLRDAATAEHVYDSGMSYLKSHLALTQLSQRPANWGTLGSLFLICYLCRLGLKRWLLKPKGHVPCLTVVR